MDGYQIPLDFNNGLPCPRIRKPTKTEVDDLPHFILTSDIEWNPTVFDNDIDDMHQFFDALEKAPHDYQFDHVGQYHFRTVEEHQVGDPQDGELRYLDAQEPPDPDEAIELIIDYLNPEVPKHIYESYNLERTPKEPDYESLRPRFGWFPVETIKKTFGVTTQFARGRVSDTLKQHWRTRFPACNVKRRNEPVATDTVFSDTPAVDSGTKAAQIFVG